MRISFGMGFAGKNVSGSTAGSVLGDEDSGLALSFEQAVSDALVRWPDNLSGEFSGDPNDLLTYASPSTKYVRNSAGVLVPGTTLRTDHDADGNALGLLIEEQQTNLFTYSLPTSANGWPSFNAPSETAGQSAPDGTTDAVNFTFSGGAGSSGWKRNSTVSASGEEHYVGSCFFKQPESDAADKVIVRFVSSAFTLGTTATYTFSTGAVEASGLGGVDIYPDGWVRLWLYAQADADGGTVEFGCGVSASQGQSTILWGAQLEEGSFPTSYIKTEGSQVTRALDDITLPQADFPWNGASGTLTINGNVVTPETVSTSFDIAQTCLVNSIDRLKTLKWVPA